MSFINIFDTYNWDEVKESIYSKTSTDVENALSKSRLSFEDFKALLSPSASYYLEQMAQISNQITQERFGKTIQLYIPLYVSNYCDNYCVYCGFNKNNHRKRIVLSDDEILKEVKVLKSYGYEHILIVSGESEKNAGVEFLKNIIDLIKPYFSLTSFEVQPLNINEYKALIEKGLNTVYIYQESYNKKKYPIYHKKGKKSDFYYRIETPDRLGKAGIRKIGIGNLVGLEDWRTEAFFTALHLSYLEKKYWKTKYSISFPRLLPHPGKTFQPNYKISDREFVQLICAYRIFNADVELSLSVRERKKLRDNAIKLGITAMSAGSKTEPGGYSSGLKEKALEQFEVYDDRTPGEIEKMIKSQGYEAVWKDWDKHMQLSNQ